MIFTTCLVGVGYWGKNYVRVLRELLQYFNLKYIVDVDQKNLDKFEHLEDIIRTTNLDEAIKNVDCVFVVTPVNTHYAIAKKVLEMGKHVFIEKPFTLKDEEAKELCILSETKKLVLMVGFILLYNSGFEYMVYYVDKNPSTAYYFDLTRTGPGIIRKDCNVIHDLTSHDLACVLRLFNKEVIDIKAVGFSRENTSKYDAVYITLTFDDNIVVHLHTSWIDYEKRRNMYLITEKYQISFEDIKEKPIKILNKGINQDDVSSYIPWIKWNEPLKTECQHFYNCIAKGEKCLSGPDLSYKVTALINQIIRKI
jgi:predicted dehydrogenase